MHPLPTPLLLGCFSRQGARCLPPDYQMVLPLAAGGNVRQLLHEQGWRPGWKQLLSLALQVGGQALAALHLALRVASAQSHSRTDGGLGQLCNAAGITVSRSSARLTLRTCATASHDGPSTTGRPNQLLPLPPPPVTSTLFPPQVASGMHHVHERGFLHCDLKPANLLALDSAASAVQIADFGLAVRDGGAGAGEQQQEEGAGSGGGVGAGSSSSSCHSRGHTADSVRAAGRPTGGFHKRQMVGVHARHE